jgi:hypothetical protein
MDATLSTLVLFLREAWTALAGALLAFAVLAGMAQILRLSSASVIGANLWVWEAISAVTSVVILALFAFLGVPQIVSALESALPSGGGCGPINELGQFAAGLIGALAALRMLKAVFASVVSVSLGASSSLSHSLIETGEAVFGMLLAGAAVPLAAWFLGTCG